uniref:Secreted protein n=1 Tax=Trichuris muris TaxID=70415 RepID=A0A5S6QKQ3_TRIMR
MVAVVLCISLCHSNCVVRPCECNVSFSRCRKPIAPEDSQRGRKCEIIEHSTESKSSFEICDFTVILANLFAAQVNCCLFCTLNLDKLTWRNGMKIVGREISSYACDSSIGLSFLL